MIPVRGADPAYAAAALSLPSRVRRADETDAALVVVRASPGGSGVVVQARAALHSGARGVVLARPGAIDPAELAELAATAHERGAVVVVERALVRADLVAGARAALADIAASEGATTVSAARIRSIDLSTPDIDLHTAVRDAVGWLRELSGGPVQARERARTPSGLLARLVTIADGTAATLVAAVGAHAPGSRLRVGSIAEARLEATIDEPAAVRQVAVATDRGAQVLPRLHEAPERVALRRAVEALSGGIRPSDLDDLRHDDAVARDLLGDKRG